MWHRVNLQIEVELEGGKIICKSRKINPLIIITFNLFHVENINTALSHSEWL